MTDKRGKLFVASKQTQGLSSKGTGGVGYSEINFKDYL